LIAKNILNGEGDSKIKQIVKENVKAVLSDNKMLISTAFAAMIQTLKADPQMINLIQNITGANDDKQHKDNHINITQYFESNNYNSFVILTKLEYQAGLIKEQSTIELLRFTIRHILKQAHNQPEYLILKE
jgi:mannitol-specific phosphotransferase system IIBC component